MGEDFVGPVLSLMSHSSLAMLREADDPDARWVVTSIHNVMEYWEAQQVILDPVQQEVVLDSLVIVLLTAARSFRKISDIHDSVLEIVTASRSADEGSPSGPQLHDRKGLRRLSAAWRRSG